MKKLTDKEIQQLLEENNTQHTTGDADMQTYRQLFDALKQEPAVTLPPGFAAGVAGRVAASKNTRLAFKFYLLAAVISILIFAVACVLLVASNKYYADMLTSLLAYKWGILFGLVVFVAVSYFDPGKQRYPQFK